MNLLDIFFLIPSEPTYSKVVILLLYRFDIDLYAAPFFVGSNELEFGCIDLLLNFENWSIHVS